MDVLKSEKRKAFFDNPENVIQVLKERESKIVKTISRIGAQLKDNRVIFPKTIINDYIRI